MRTVATFKVKLHISSSVKCEAMKCSKKDSQSQDRRDNNSRNSKKKKKSLSGNEVSVFFFSPAYPLFHFVLTYLSISHFSQSKISLLTSLQFSGSILVSLFQLLPFLSSLSASLSHWASLCLYLDLTFPALCLLEIETKNSMFSLSFISLYGTKRYPKKS